MNHPHIPPRTLLIDAGQTGLRTALPQSERCAESEIRLEGAGVRTDEPLLPQLTETIGRIVRETGEAVETVAAGVSGLSSADRAEDLLRSLRSDPLTSRVERVVLAHDSATSYLSALGHAPGVVVAAGTGVVTLGVGREKCVRVDGWGNLVGDAGSAYWIGRRGLECALRSFDGRDGASALLEMFLREFPDLSTAYLNLQTSSDRVRRIAAYSRIVTALADRDPTAARICDAAAAELALSASTALRQAGASSAPAPAVRGVGGVFASPQVADRFAAKLRSVHPGVDVAFPPPQPIRGAARLLTLPARSPLRTLVDVASA